MKHLKYSILSDCIDMIFEQNPAGIKQVFDSLGIADSCFAPLVQVDASLSKRIDQFVKDTAK
jgi:4-hydroxy-tetrahydrodipicolinate synthase